MGWDAFATKPDGTDACVVRVDSSPIEDVPEFKRRADEVRSAVGTCDGLLAKAALDCSACAYALENATYLNAWHEDGWSPDEVKHAAANANWKVCKQEPWAVESAKAFLETCAELGYGIRFSW